MESPYVRPCATERRADVWTFLCLFVCSWERMTSDSFDHLSQSNEWVCLQWSRNSSSSDRKRVLAAAVCTDRPTVFLADALSAGASSSLQLLDLRFSRFFAFEPHVEKIYRGAENTMGQFQSPIAIAFVRERLSWKTTDKAWSQVNNLLFCVRTNHRDRFVQTCN